MRILIYDRSLALKKLLQILRGPRGALCDVMSDAATACSQEDGRKLHASWHGLQLFVLCSCQEWERSYKELLYKIPSDGSEEQEKGEQALRNHVAARWLDLQSRGQGPDDLRKFAARLDALAEMQGRDVPCAPHPVISKPDEPASSFHALSPGSSPENAKPGSLHHEFRFLKVEQGVWTVLVVWGTVCSVLHQGDDCIGKDCGHKFSLPRLMADRWTFKDTAT